MANDATLDWASTPTSRADQPDAVLLHFRRALEKLYGERLDRVVLFGSRARGDARPDSDYDVAVFLKTRPNFWTEAHKLADLRVNFLDDYGAFFEAIPFAVSAYNDRTPLLHEIRKDGIDI